MNDLIITSSPLKLTFQQIDKQYDSEPIFRAYCVQSPNVFNVQIRGTVPLQTERVLSNNKPRNLIATICLTKEEILLLAEYVKAQ